jgi:phospholipase/carboxylesterase
MPVLANRYTRSRPTGAVDATDDPHRGQPNEHSGAPLRVADAALVLLHGRGSTARDVLGLTERFHRRGVAYVAPQAHDSRWYPRSFLAPVASNEPHLSSALAAVDAAVAGVVERGVPHDRVVVGGFSQGACLAAEYVARNPRQYGGLVVLSGGLVGPEGTTFEHSGDLAGTPVFLGCSDVDPDIPVERVHESRDAFERLGGDVTERIYGWMGHVVSDDEVAFVGGLLDGLLRDARDANREAGDDERAGEGG